MNTKTMQFFFLLVSFFIIDANKPVFSQEKTLGDALDYLNVKFQGKCKFDSKDGDLTINFFKNGKKYRTDKMEIKDLDFMSVTYSQEEGGIIIKCYETVAGCIARETELGQQNKSYNNRILFVYEGDEKSIQGIQNALIHAIRLIREKKYHSTTPFEK